MIRALREAQELIKQDRHEVLSRGGTLPPLILYTELLGFSDDEMRIQSGAISKATSETLYNDVSAIWFATLSTDMPTLVRTVVHADDSLELILKCRDESPRCILRNGLEVSTTSLTLERNRAIRVQQLFRDAISAARLSLERATAVGKPAPPANSRRSGNTVGADPAPTTSPSGGGGTVGISSAPGASQGRGMAGGTSIPVPGGTSSAHPNSSSTPGAVDTLPGQRDIEQAQFHERVARAAMNDGDLTIAARELAEAARLAPTNALNWYNLGIVESKRSNPARAVEHFKRALQLGLPPKEKARADDLLAEATYLMRKTGSDVKAVLYGLGFGLTFDQLLSRGEQLELGEASQYGDRYRLHPREDAIGGEQDVRLYFGSQGLQRIWLSLPGGWADEIEVIERFGSIERLLRSRGFQEYLRTQPPAPLRLGHRLPHGIRFRNGALRADLMMSLTLDQPSLNRFHDRVAVEDIVVIIWDSQRCPTCDR